MRIQQLDGSRAPQPQPLDSGFSTATGYRVLGMHTPSETADAYVVLSNDRDEMWFICTRHLRVLGIDAGVTDPRVPLSHFKAVAGPGRKQWPAEAMQMSARDDHR